MIARQLAGILCWKLWDDSLLEEVSELVKLDCASVQRHDEKLDPYLYRLSKALLKRKHDHSPLLASSERFDSDSMVSIMSQLARRICREGNSIIVGRGASYLLQGEHDVFRLFLYAPFSDKLRRVCASGKSPNEAAASMTRADQEQRAFVKHYFGSEWPCSSIFHLMLNTNVGDESVVSTVLATIDQLNAVGVKNSA